MTDYKFLFRESSFGDSFKHFKDEFNKETGGDLKKLMIHKPEETEKYLVWNVSTGDKSYQLRHDGNEFSLYEESK